MPSLLITSTILITLALIFYSLGVWSERLARYLKHWHVAAFWIGFTFDISGTYAMHLVDTIFWWNVSWFEQIASINFTSSVYL